MEVTEVTLRLFEPQPNPDQTGVVAFANIVLDSTLAIKGIRLVRVRGVLLASMPNKEKQRECEKCRIRNDITNKFCHSCGISLTRIESSQRIFMDMVHPVCVSLRKQIEEVLICEYERVKKQ